LPVPDWSKPIILALVLIALWLAIRSRLSVKRARRLEAQRTVLAADLGALQAALVPDLGERVGDLRVSVSYRPADGPAAGGDFYDVFELAERRVGIILGDASGHGRKALGRATLTRYTLRAYVEAGMDPRDALRLAGQVLSGDGEEFTTIVVAIHDPDAGTLTYATAGHPPPILLGEPLAERPAAWASPPIGWGVPTGRAQTTVTLANGAFACFYSDGLTEARAGAAMLGRTGLCEILLGLGDRPTAAAGDADDMAVCIIQSGQGGETAWREEDVEVDAAQLAGSRIRRFLAESGVPAAEAARAIALAGPIAAEHGSVRFRVAVDAGTVAVAPAQRPEGRVPVAV
jgi:hypothetical protein